MLNLIIPKLYDMKKTLFLLVAAALMMGSCGQSSKNGGDTDSTNVADSTVAEAAVAEQDSPYASPDLMTNGIYGKVTSVVIKNYLSNSKQTKEGFLYEEQLAFNEKGEWIANEMARFKKSGIKRDEQGRIISLAFSAGDNGAMSYTYGYSYEGNRVKTFTVDYEGELSGDNEQTFIYDAEGELAKVVTVGYSEGVKFDITYEYIVKERDSHNNWTKRYVRRVEVQTYDDEDDPGTPDTIIEHQYQIRTLKYAE